MPIDDQQVDQPMDPRAAKLIQAAQEIVRETGDFELPMRQLAARAQVSLRTPYELFGSKNGIIRVMLKGAQAEFRELSRALHSIDRLENIFDRAQLGIDFYAREQPFYRALFRATQAYSGGDESEPARETLLGFVIMCRRASIDGHLRPEIDPAQMGEILTDLFAANVRNWAGSDFDIQLAGQRIAYGFAIALAGAANDADARRLHAKALVHQATIQRMEEEDGKDEPAQTSRAG